jgi:hypothetical protein
MWFADSKPHIGGVNIAASRVSENQPSWSTEEERRGKG